MNSFSIEAAFRFGWDTFKKRPGFFVGMTVIILLVSWLTGFVMGFIGLEQSFIGKLVSLAVTTLLDLGVVATMLKAYDSAESVQLNDLWHPQMYLTYLAATVLMAIIVVVGLILVIIPGIYAATMLVFTKFVVVDRKLGPIEALKESARITKGHRLTIFLLILAVAAVNIVGAILILIPLLVTIPVSTLAMVYAYRTIGHQASEVVPAAPAAAPTV